MTIKTIGIDLAKNVFQIHGVDERGNTVMKKRIRRPQLMTFFANMAPCLIGMEACAGAHYWARLLTEQGHEVKLMAPQFVKPYVKTNKNDAADAEAICEAVTRPSMRFVSIKTSDQQGVLSLHRARSGFIKTRTAAINQVRGLLSEFGIIIPQGRTAVRKHLPTIIENGDQDLPDVFRQVLMTLYEHLIEIGDQIDHLNTLLEAHFRQCPLCQRIAGLPGIGMITATALVGAIGNGKEFKNGRQLSAWLGLVPRQHSSGGKNVLLGISKRGDPYLRSLLIQGARSVLIAHKNKICDTSWAGRLLLRRNSNVAAVALANKNVRTLWAMLTKDEDYNNKAYPNAFAA